MYFVYFLLDKNHQTYLGCTNNLQDRFRRHQSGYVAATKLKRPLVLVSYFAFQNKHTAFEFEQYLKSSSGRSFIKKHKLLENH